MSHQVTGHVNHQKQLGQLRYLQINNAHRQPARTAVDRFPKAGDYCSYCRVVRAKKTSNGKKKGNNNSKNGNKYLSWAFTEAVHRAIATCPPAKKFYSKKKTIAIAKGGGALATKALAAKWCKAAYYIMKRQEPFDLARVFG